MVNAAVGAELQWESFIMAARLPLKEQLAQKNANCNFFVIPNHVLPPLLLCSWMWQTELCPICKRIILFNQNEMVYSSSQNWSKQFVHKLDWSMSRLMFILQTKSSFKSYSMKNFTFLYYWRKSYRFEIMWGWVNGRIVIVKSELPQQWEADWKCVRMSNPGRTS